MSQATLFSRVSHWIKTRKLNGELPIHGQLPLEEPSAPGEAPDESHAIERATPGQNAGRLRFWRPWARQDAALASLQRGFDNIAELMTSIRSNLEQQGRRQDEMISHLAQLPDAFKTMPEAQRVQAESLKAIGQQLQQQVRQQDQLTGILAQVSATAGDQRKMLENIYGRVDGITDRDDEIAQGLKQVGAAMENAGQASHASAAVLQQLHQDLSARSGEVERALQKQDKRVILMLSAALGLSAAALITAIVLGCLLLRKAPAPVPTPSAAVASAEAPARP